MARCTCTAEHEQQRVVLTGGPGAGKTAFLELVRQSLCQHVMVLPESASVLFSGGFPRDDDRDCRRAAQRAIYHVQRELEAVAVTHRAAVVICDRGSIDGLAYWPGDVDDFWEDVGTTREVELARYEAVIHLRTPSSAQGYNHRNPLRTETAEAALAIDARILEVWAGHPHHHVVESSHFYLEKAATALRYLQGQLPACCVNSLQDAGGGDAP
ncbi:MAG TPA: ATP-binding protein [Ornithinibacter sp.]|nr:ATP-binding protein [Ornithinibacter sp.]